MLVTYGGNIEANSILYGERHPATIDYMRSKVDQAMQFSRDYGAVLGSQAVEFYQKTQQMLEAAIGEDSLRRARAALNRVSHVLQVDSIREMNKIEDLQNAPLLMQRFIMADDLVRRLYKLERLDGYSDTYFDPDPDQQGIWHYDRRRVMEGMINAEPDGEGSDYSYQLYFDELKEGDRHLTFEEKLDVMSVWENIRAHIEHGDRDPTSVRDEKL